MVNRTVSRYKTYWNMLKAKEEIPKRMVFNCPPQLWKRFKKAMEMQRTDDLDWKVEHSPNPLKLSCSYDHELQRITFTLTPTYHI